MGLHANRMRHDSGFRIFSRLGAGGALSWTHWPLGKLGTPRAVGGLIVSTIDNILYPILVGSHLRAHTATILLSVLGGIALFGPTGIVLGPVLFTVATDLLEVWRSRTSSEASPT